MKSRTVQILNADVRVVSGLNNLVLELKDLVNGLWFTYLIRLEMPDQVIKQADAIGYIHSMKFVEHRLFELSYPEINNITDTSELISKQFEMNFGF